MTFHTVLELDPVSSVINRSATYINAYLDSIRNMIGLTLQLSGKLAAKISFFL